MGCRPRARFVLHCHGVWGLRHGPWTRADGRKKQGLKLVSISRQFRKQRLARWAAGRGPDPSFAAMVFWCCDRVRQEKTSKLAGGRWRAGKSPSLELVSREFRKQRLEPWAAGRGPDPSFAAMVFWCCDRVRQEKTSKLAGGRWRAGKVQVWS